MTWRAEVGFDVSVIGALKATITDDGGSFDIEWTEGTYAPTNMQSVEGSGNYLSFPSNLQSKLNSGTSSAGTYTVVVSNGGSLGKSYEIVNSAANFAVDFLTWGDLGTRLRRVLGFSGNVSGASSHTSDQRPYYVLIGASNAATEPTDDYRKGDRTRVVETRGGKQFAQRFEAGITYSDWELAGQPDAETYSRRATSTVPWTFEDFLDHASAIEPFAVIDDNESTVHRLREDGADFTERRRSRMFRAFRGQMIWTFRTRVEGRL